MKIALHNADKTKFPNLALMKLSAWHKGVGNDVSIYENLLHSTYDMVYSSKVFTFTKSEKPFGHVVWGGTGYDSPSILPPDCEHIMPDYDIYHTPYSIGFATRGCIRNCEFCMVPKKEGKIKVNADIYEFWDKRHDSIIFLDNNIFAAPKHFEKIAEQLLREKLKADFNQGLDIRLLTKDKAKILKQLKPYKQWRFAFDSMEYEDDFRKGAELLLEVGIPKYKISVYVLAGCNTDIFDAIKRIDIVYNQYGFDPFVMPFKNLNGDATPNNFIDLQRKVNLPAWKKYKSLKDLARWANHKAIFKSVAWKDYNR